MGQTLRSYKRPSVFQFIVLGFGLVLAIGLFAFLRGFVSCWRLTALPGMAPASCPYQTTPIPAVTNNQGTVVSGETVTSTPEVSIPQSELPPPWDGASRVNILVMGYDYGDWRPDRGCPCRTDTMIVVSIDPVSKSIGMLSVPRDMWVNIPPDFGYHKINTANYLGDLNKLPGGGGELARKTVEDFLGVPINYYVMVDFEAFTKVVQTIAGDKGICMNIPERIKIDPIGEGNTQKIGPGPDCLNGSETLAYARMRYTENDDVDRSTRQMQVIMAVRDAALRPDNLPNLFLHANDLYNQVSAGIKTNMQLPDAVALARLATQIPAENIHQSVIDYTMMAPTTIFADNVEQAILRPFTDKIRELVAQIFGSGSENPMAAANPAELDLEQVTPLMKDEAASVIVINASGVEGMAAKTADYLKSQGVNVTNFGNTGDYPDAYGYLKLPGKTGLIVHVGRPYVMQYLMKVMNTDSFIMSVDPNAPADIILAIGSDWANNNPMP